MGDGVRPLADGAPLPNTDWRSQGPAFGFVVVAGLVVTLWLSQMRWPAPTMEEGFMLDLPLRVLHGAVPERSFYYFYGPVSLWIPAAAYWVFGASLLIERAVGAFYLSIFGWSLYAIGRRWSTSLGLVMAIGAVLVEQFSSVGLITALPEIGAIGFGLLGVAIGSSKREGLHYDLATGVSLAVAADLRPDYVIWGAVLVGVILALRMRGYLTAVAYLAGLVPYLILITTAGFGNVWRGIVVASARLPAERRLPLTSIGLTGLAVVVLLIGLVVVGAGGLRRRRTRLMETVVLLVVVCLVTVPEVAQRADGYHLASLGGAATGAAPLAVYLLATEVPRTLIRSALGAVISVLVLAAVAHAEYLFSAHKYLDQLSGRPVSYAVHNHGRTWYYANPITAARVREVVAVADRLGTGAGPIFVGTRDLSQTPYVDDSIYFLLPQFSEQSHFYDFHPGIALYDGRQLAADVGAARTLVLVKETLPGPKLAEAHGSQLANKEVAADFSLLTKGDGYYVYERRP
jgi:hypothetical protein